MEAVPATSSPFDPQTLSLALLSWYDAEGRHLPWRVRTAEISRQDPYKVWLSEVMLQQTTVAAVSGYYMRFLEQWPTVEALAAAPLDDVMAAWAGLGYYARARNLHRCAQAIVTEHGGRFPDDEALLRKLPGVGRYTAAAIAAIAFGRRAVVVDGNVERVMARLFAVETPLPAAKGDLAKLADTLTPETRCGDYAQAVMDLGATLCTPKSPACGLCPWMRACEGRKQGLAESLPRKAAKTEKPTRYGTAFWIVRWDGSVLLRRRPPSGLLGGMMEIPSTPWRSVSATASKRESSPETGGPWSPAEAIPLAPLKCDWRPIRGTITHTFTHFHLVLSVLAGVAKGGDLPGCKWVDPANLPTEALPSVMRKVVRLAQGHG